MVDLFTPDERRRRLRQKFIIRQGCTLYGKDAHFGIRQRCVDAHLLTGLVQLAAAAQFTASSVRQKYLHRLLPMP
jgi:hypothetical protein